MEQYEARQDAMQGDIDGLKSKMDQLMEMMTAQHRRDEERAANEAAAVATAAAPNNVPATFNASTTTQDANTIGTSFVANTTIAVVSSFAVGNTRVHRGANNTLSFGWHAGIQPITLWDAF